jgi:hypothetical protein
VKISNFLDCDVKIYKEIRDLVTKIFNRNINWHLEGSRKTKKKLSAKIKNVFLYVRDGGSKERVKGNSRERSKQ